MFIRSLCSAIRKNASGWVILGACCQRNNASKEAIRRISDGNQHGELFRHAQNVAPLIEALRYISSIVAPSSACCATNAICPVISALRTQ